MVNTFDTAKVDIRLIEKAAQEVFDLSPAGIVKTLDLCRPIYQKTASYGHFERGEFPWEKTNKVEESKRFVGGRA